MLQYEYEMYFDMAPHSSVVGRILVSSVMLQYQHEMYCMLQYQYELYSDVYAD